MFQCTSLHFCMANVLCYSCFEEKDYGKIHPNPNYCLVQSKTNPVRNLEHFKIHCTPQGFHPSSLINQINQVLRKQYFWSWHAFVRVYSFPIDHCTKGCTATLISWGALNQMGITSKVLTRLLTMRCQNTRK